MNDIALIADTGSSLPVDLAEKLNITLIPVMVHFGKETFQAVLEIDDRQVFERIDRENKLATTSAPTTQHFIDLFQQTFAKGHSGLLCITTSSKISSAYQAALVAREHFADKAIVILDSQTISMAEGFQAVAAAEVLNKGGTLQQSVAAAERTRENCHAFFALATLKYMSMSGRIGYLAAGIASLLDMKPILSVMDGEMGMIERVRSQPRAWERIIELTVEKAAGSRVQRLAVVHVNAPEAAAELEAQLRQFLLCPDEITIAELNPSLSIHSGSGTVGIVVVTD